MVQPPCDLKTNASWNSAPVQDGAPQRLFLICHRPNHRYIHCFNPSYPSELKQLSQVNFQFRWGMVGWIKSLPPLLNVPQRLKTRVHVKCWEISDWPIWFLIDHLSKTDWTWRTFEVSPPNNENCWKLVNPGVFLFRVCLFDSTNMFFILRCVA
jgi:hypothetical protein